MQPGCCRDGTPVPSAWTKDGSPLGRYTVIPLAP